MVTGLAVLTVVVLVMYARRVDGIEVVATILFVPIFLAFVFRGVLGGVIAAAAAVGVYAAMRDPAIDAVGVGEFTGLIASRAAAYLIFGAVGGWSTQVLEGSLTKLELYDEIDDETGLFNARHLLNQTDLETARARRYQTLFSVVTIDLPAAPFAALKGRERRAVLRDLGRLVREGVRNVDHVVHARDGERATVWQRSCPRRPTKAPRSSGPASTSGSSPTSLTAAWPSTPTRCRPRPSPSRATTRRWPRSGSTSSASTPPPTADGPAAGSAGPWPGQSGGATVEFTPM